ncbi:hypothetical protein [Micromonospora eburnea]|uniref:Uncharacterized protein n=1 Tax=Micromonospora eburnea TaxID=227316 RepID=A0A1C6UAX0_9ACTN|nr:hypothetical protein [Micromonospora eburnea]SCL51166.1 hypothetical protein GA0070604_2298 [Micromonospora eburnea]
MPAEREVIDLDELDSQPADGTAPGRLTTRRKMNLGLVAAFVVGVVLGGVGVNELRDSRQERERNAAVSLVAFPASISGGGSNAIGVLEMNGQLAVINAGPAPVTVRAATGQRPGLRLHDTGQSRLLRPAGTVWIDVRLSIECASAFSTEPLSIRFSVETADGQATEVSYPVAVAGSRWQDGAELPCAQIVDTARRGG